MIETASEIKTKYYCLVCCLPVDVHGPNFRVCVVVEARHESYMIIFHGHFSHGLLLLSCDTTADTEKKFN